jgi:hypothetical protein
MIFIEARILGQAEPRRLAGTAALR